MTFTHEAGVVDELLTVLGWYGRYQQVQFVTAMVACLSCAFHAMSIIFIGRLVAHKCAPVDRLNVTIPVGGAFRSYDVINDQSEASFNVTYGSCSIQVTNGTTTVFETSCLAGYQYDQPVDRSFVSEWDLVCERQSLSDVSQTLLSLGQTLGAFVFTALADRYGRKPVYMATNLVLLVVATGIAFAPSISVFMVLRFALGALQQGIGLVSTIMLLELLPKDRRALHCNVGNFVWVGSLMTLCLLAYLSRDLSWRHTELILAGGAVYVIVQWWLTDETLRWLLTNNKHEELERVLKKAAHMNKVEWTTVQAVLKRSQAAAALVSINSSCASPSDSFQLSTSGDSEKNGTAKDQKSLSAINGGPGKMAAKKEMRLMAFVKNKHVMLMTAISCFMWFTDCVTYYGLLLTSSSLADDVYLGFFLSVLAEVPTAIAFPFVIDRLGRKKCLVIAHLIAGLSLLAATILSNLSLSDTFPGIKIVVLCIALIGKFGVSSAFAVIWLYTSELYPTNLRNTGFGISSLAARIGGMIAPFSRTFSLYLPWGPGAVFTVLCLLVPIVIRFLPETKGQELPHRLEDLEKWFPPGDTPRPTETEDTRPTETGDTRPTETGEKLRSTEIGEKLRATENGEKLRPTENGEKPLPTEKKA